MLSFNRLFPFKPLNLSYLKNGSALNFTLRNFVIQAKPQNEALGFGQMNLLRSLKTKSSVKKRFKLTGSGKIMRGRAGKRHNTGYLSRAKVRMLSNTVEVTEKKIKNKLLRLLGM